MKEGIKTGLRKTRIPLCVAAPLQQQTCDTISKLQQNLWCIRAMTTTESKYHRPQKFQQGDQSFSPYLFFIQVGQMIAQEVDLVEIFFLLLRANLPDVPKIHSQIFINPMTTNVVAIHKKL